MEIINIKNGHIIYNGTQYLIMHDYYGLVAYSESIERNNDNGSVKITFIKADLMPYNNSYITRKINELERQFIYKEIEIKYIDEKFRGGGYGSIQKKYTSISILDR